MAKPGQAEQQFRDLVEQFRALGAPDPESWARSQIDEGIPQYSRFVFLQAAWKSVIADGDTAWMDQRIQRAEAAPDAPGAGAGLALTRLLAAGASREDLSELVRVMQWELLTSLLYQLDDPGAVEYPSNKLPRVGWALVELDDNDEPKHVIDSLHESVLETDPAGREMRPKVRPTG